MIPYETDVLIAGGGPCGLMLAIELGRRGVRAVLVDPKPGTAFNPQANATQARTMEHFRRLGFADEIRALGLPGDYPTDIAYFTRYTAHELGRVRLPSSAEAVRRIRGMGGSWSAAEPPHRVAQKFVEQVLHRHARALPGIAVHFGWRLAAFAEDRDGIAATVTETGSGAERPIRARYLFGADGPRSFVRHALGIGYGGDGGARRDFMGGRMHAIYLHAPDFYAICPHPPAWMYWTFNRERRALMAAVDGAGEFAFHAQLHPEEEADEAGPDEAAAVAMVEQAVGARIPLRILGRMSWLAGRALVADRFGAGRVFLGGDAAHLFTPTGGMGYNTAIEDAVNIGWKLAAVIRRGADPALLASYAAERRPVAIRNTGFARGFADSVGLYRPSPALETDSLAGTAARARAGAYLEQHARAEFNIPGLTLGGRYDGSPIIADDGTPPPPDAAGAYVPTGKPGGRAPHVWLADGRSLFDTFGFEWTLLRLGPAPPSPEMFVAAARMLGIDLAVVTCEDAEAFDLYESDLVLIRPDQVVAWRRDGRDGRVAAAVLARAAGAQPMA